MTRIGMAAAVLLLVGCGVGAGEKAGLAGVFTEKLTDANGKEVTLASLQNKFVGIYFSAHWCPPCRAFTPKLVKFRDANKQVFEVVFVSADRSEKDKKKYMTGAKMQWPAVPFKGKNSKALEKKFDVQGIPKLVILDNKGNLLTANGRDDVSSNAAGAIAKWTKMIKK